MTKKQKYPMFSCRLSEELQEKLKAAKNKSGKDWELFIRDLYENRLRKN